MAVSSLLCEVNESGFCYVVQCDRCRNRVDAKDPEAHFASRPKVIEAARAKGWLVDPSRTLCPACRRKRVR